MEQFKSRAYFEDFPFLSRYVREEWEISVQRVDNDLLSSKRGYRRSKDTFGMDFPVYDHSFVFLDENGIELGRAFQRWLYRVPKSWFRSSFVEKPEFPGDVPMLCTAGSEKTVGEALNLLKNPEIVHYILRLSESGSTIGPHQVTIFKPPQSFTLRGWLDQETNKARQKIREEIEQNVDAVTQ